MNNNLSRQIFREFINNNKYDRVDSHGNVFIMNDKKYCFVLCNSIDNLSCRQFYEDCDGIVFCINNIFYIQDTDLDIRSFTGRAGANGIKFTQAYGNPDKIVELVST